MKTTLIGVATALLLALPATLSGQATVQVGGGFTTLTGDDFAGVDAGYTLGGGLLFNANSRVQIGGELKVHSFAIDDVDERLDQIDVLAKARVFIPNDAGRIFLGAKAGYARQDTEVAGVEVETDGFTAGPTAGIVIPLSDLMLEISGNMMYVSQDESDDEFIDDEIEIQEAGGIRYSLEAGLAIPLGGG